MADFIRLLNEMSVEVLGGLSSDEDNEYENVSDQIPHLNKELK